MTLWQRFSDFTARLCAPSPGSESGTDQPASAPGGTASSDLSTAFTMAVIALSAKMAKADGVVAPVEVEMFYRVFHTPDNERANIDYVFGIAKADTAGFEAYAEQIKDQLHDDKPMLGEVLASLFHIATADRALHPREDDFLKVVAARFSLTDSEFRHIRAQFVHDDTSPYDVLGLTPHDDNATIKARHRKLVRENHPDLLMGRGLPTAMIDVANRQLAAINDAYATIAKERGL